MSAQHERLRLAQFFDPRYVLSKSDEPIDVLRTMIDGCFKCYRMLTTGEWPQGAWQSAG